MNEMVATNSGAVTITSNDNNIQLWIGQLDASSKRNSTTMSGVQCIKIHIAGGSGGAADTGNNDGFISIQTFFLNGLNNGLGCYTITTAWTPEMWQAVLAKILFKGSFQY